MLTLIPSLLFAYLPGNWNAKHAVDDFEKSDYVLMVRCVGIDCVEGLHEGLDAKGERYQESMRSYFARLRIGEVLKGEIPKGQELRLYIGSDSNMGASDNFKPEETSPIPKMHNTQIGYNVTINRLYKMYLVKTGTGIDLRSGPFSLGMVNMNGKVQYGKLGGLWQDEVELSYEK